MASLIRAYRNVDPPKQSQKAITPRFLTLLYKHFVDDRGRNEGDSLNAHFVDLYIGMFFFAARACEFCKTRSEGKTKRITMGDLTFRDRNKNTIEINQEEDIERARFVTVRFRDQKNGEKNEKRTQGRTGRRDLDPVIRLAWAVLRIKRRVTDWGATTEMCTIGTRSNQLRISDEVSLELIRSICRIYGGQDHFGFSPKEIGNRSLRSGAAMALALSPKNYGETQIMILGRWKSNAFMAYIRPQMLELTSGLAADMTQVSGTDLRERRRDTEENGDPGEMELRLDY